MLRKDLVDRVGPGSSMAEAMADPGFPRGGGANPPGGGGHQYTILPKFPKNCMKLKEFGLWGRLSRPL